jgi:ribosome biogenesis GTPase
MRYYKWQGADLQVEGRVLQIMGKYHMAWDGERVRPAFPGGRLELTSRGMKNRVAVGDRVALRLEEDGSALIEDVCPRGNKLSRKMTFTGREHVVAANIDVVAVVLAPNPDLNTALLDRYLVAAHAAGIDALCVVNKMDLLTPELVEESMAPYRALGLPIFCTCAREKKGLGPFLEAVAGRWVLLAGHSGAGKTTLVNDVDLEASKPVREVNAATGKGKHSTSSAEAHVLPDGTVLVDTAGIREFALWDVDWRGVEAAFPDIFHTAEGCRFPDCRHLSEPACAVASAVEEGTIAPERYSSYLTLIGECS